jgi:hypothetical protein
MTYVFVLFGVLAAAAAGLLAWLGDGRGAAAAVMIAVAAFGFRGPGGNPRAISARRWWLLSAVFAAGVAVLIWSSVPLVILVALFIAKVLVNLRLLRNLGRMTVEPQPGVETMPGAVPLAQEFTAAGFEAIGSHRCRPAGLTISVTVMLGSQRDRVALVTDRVWQVASRFGRRWLVTSNSGLSPLPADVMRQEIPEGRPHALVQAHDAALDVLRARGLQPDQLRDPTDALEAARDLERHAIAFLRHCSLQTAVGIEMSTRPSGPPLDSGNSASARIDAWMQSSAVA